MHLKPPSAKCTGYDNTAYVDYMDLAVRCSRKAVKLNHSLTHRLRNVGHFVQGEMS